MKYPFRDYSNKFRAFRDKNNIIKCYVTRASNFENINEVNKYLVVNGLKKSIKIEECYVRYYLILPKKCECGYIIENSVREGYTFCSSGRGAFKVYKIERK